MARIINVGDVIVSDGMANGRFTKIQDYDEKGCKWYAYTYRGKELECIDTNFDEHFGHSFEIMSLDAYVMRKCGFITLEAAHQAGMPWKPTHIKADKIVSVDAWGDDKYTIYLEGGLSYAAHIPGGLDKSGIFSRIGE